jgi:hypothetical protein
MNANPVANPVENTWNSIYIPTIPQDLMIDDISCTTVDGLTNYFENKICVGKVRRVDLITKPRGNYTLLAAFIHFDEWFPESDKMRNHLNHPKTNGEFKLGGYFSKSLNHFVNFYSSQNSSFHRFLCVKINKTPIPEIAPMDASDLNIHQLVHSLELARETIANNEKLIAEQNDRIAELEKLLAEKTVE